MGPSVPHIHWCSEQTGSFTIASTGCYGSHLYDRAYWRLFCYDLVLNSLDEKISDSVMFLPTAKEMWDTLKIMYGNEKNSSRVFEIYEHLFKLKHGDKSMAEFYRELKSLVDELEMHQPVVTDPTILRGYRQDLAVSKFLSGL